MIMLAVMGLKQFSIQLPGVKRVMIKFGTNIKPIRKVLKYNSVPPPLFQKKIPQFKVFEDSTI